jgi:hypothetical protein
MAHLLFALLSLGGAPAAADDPSSALLAELRKLGVMSALVVPSQAIDEQPVWSPDGRQLALNIDEKWSAIDIRALKLQAGTWHNGEPVGVVALPPTLVAVPEAEIGAWQENARFDPRRITTAAGTTVELAEEELGTVFRITKKGSKPEVLWRTSLENCHSLAVSPGEKLVAFICELNGLIVASVEP